MWTGEDEGGLGGVSISGGWGTRMGELNMKKYGKEKRPRGAVIWTQRRCAALSPLCAQLALSATG